MTAFKKIMIAVAFIGLCLWLSRQHKPDMTLVYPDDCSFTLDSNFSQTMKSEIKSFIDRAYKENKKPASLLPSIESQFPVIRSIIVDMQNPDQLNFTIQAYQPMFMVNDSFVLSEQGQIFDKAVFENKLISQLENVTYDGTLHHKDIDRLIKFVGSLSDPILQDFSIRWVGKYNVWLDQKNGDDLSLLVGYSRPPTILDIAECRNLRGQVIDKPCKDKRGKPCKSNSTWVCDLRFDQQIVLFSTNKGG